MKINRIKQMLIVIALLTAVTFSAYVGTRYAIEGDAEAHRTVIVNDRSRKEVVTYYGSPENKDGVTILHDATIISHLDVSHLVE